MIVTVTIPINHITVSKYYKGTVLFCFVFTVLGTELIASWPHTCKILHDSV